jgi:hypothetical protein
MKVPRTKDFIASSAHATDLATKMNRLVIRSMERKEADVWAICTVGKIATNNPRLHPTPQNRMRLTKTYSERFKSHMKCTAIDPPLPNRVRNAATNNRKI